MISKIHYALFAVFIATCGPAAAQVAFSPLGGQNSPRQAVFTQPVTLTDGATITIPCPRPNGVGTSLYLTLTGNNHEILFPSCGPASNGGKVTFYINAGNNSGAAYTGLTFANGFAWTGGSAYAICTAAATPNPACPSAEVANQNDEFGCDVIGTNLPSTAWFCWTPQYKIIVPGVFALVAQTSCAGNAGTGCTTAASSGNWGSANLVVVCTGYFNAGSGQTSPISDSQSNTYTSVYSTASGNNTGEMHYVQTTNLVNSMTFTVAESGGTTYPSITVMGFSGSAASPLDQSASTGSGGSSVTTQSPGSITPTQSNELLVSCLSAGGTATSYTVGSPFTLHSSPISGVSGTNIGSAMAYLIQSSATAENPAWNWTNSGVAIAGQASFK